MWGDESADALKFTDNPSISIGASNDLQLYHNGSHSVISNQGGNLYIRQQTNDGDILFQCDDGSGGDAEYFRLDGGTTSIIASKKVALVDDVERKIGTGNDLNIRNKGSTSFIKNETGELSIDNANDYGDRIYRW